MRANAIYKRIKDIPEPIGAEIGVHRGETSSRLLSLHPGLTLVMIDAWSEETYKNSPDGASQPFKEIYEKKCKENFEIACLSIEDYNGRATIIKGFSESVSKSFPEHNFDFVFIDASHDYYSVKADIIAWLPKIKNGGWICGHDYGVENFPGVKQAVDELFNKSIENIIEIDEDFTWFVRRPGISMRI